MAQSVATQHSGDPDLDLNPDLDTNLLDTNLLDTTGLCLLSLDGGGVRGYRPYTSRAS
jgi:hypothetical protein